VRAWCTSHSVVMKNAEKERSKPAPCRSPDHTVYTTSIPSEMA
jgi:hypothetical protein